VAAPEVEEATPAEEPAAVAPEVEEATPAEEPAAVAPEVEEATLSEDDEDDLSTVEWEKPPYELAMGTLESAIEGSGLEQGELSDLDSDWQEALDSTDVPEEAPDPPQPPTLALEAGQVLGQQHSSVVLALGADPGTETRSTELTVDFSREDASGPLSLPVVGSGLEGALGSDQFRDLMSTAISAWRSGDSDKALEIYTDLLHETPSFVPAWLARGRCHLDRADWTAAISDFRKAEDLAPRSPEPYLAMGDLFVARKEYASALQRFDEALAHDVNHAMARFRRGVTHFYQSNHRQAFLDLQRAYNLDPEIPNIRRFVQLAVRKLESSEAPGA